MNIVKRYPNGIFCWVDLATTDTEAAKAFYQALFGWEYDEIHADGAQVYTMCKIDGKNVAGLSVLDAESRAQGIPPMWSSYVKHDDVETIAAKVTEAGGNLILPPMDVMDEGRMIFATDPTGAAFGVWEPKNHIGANLVNMPNTLVWNELQTRDVDAAKEFYAAVFGWGQNTDQSGYVTFKTDERVHSGMMQIDESWGEVPPNWTVYFMVEDAAASTAKIKELGGNVLVSLTKAGEMGTFSVVQDPQGAAFTIMQFDGPTDPPPGIE